MSSIVSHSSIDTTDLCDAFLFVLPEHSDIRRDLSIALKPFMDGVLVDTVDILIGQFYSTTYTASLSSRKAYSSSSARSSYSYCFYINFMGNL
jgi:hypothetical protein